MTTERDPIQLYKLYTYDLWGNSRDGYEVNDVYYQGELTINENWTDKEITLHLKREGHIDRNIQHRSLNWQGETGFTLYLNYKGYPALELRAVNRIKWSYENE